MPIYLSEFPKLLALQDEICSSPEFVKFLDDMNINYQEVKKSNQMVTYLITLFNMKRNKSYD